MKSYCFDCCSDDSIDTIHDVELCPEQFLFSCNCTCCYSPMQFASALRKAIPRWWILMISIWSPT
jgi:hypothetical protein